MRTSTTFGVLMMWVVLAAGCEEKAPPAAAPKPATPKAPVSAPAPSNVPPASPPSQAPAQQAPAPQAPATSAPAGQTPGGINVMGLSFALPATWKSVPPANQMRLAEVQVPDASGDAGKMCTIVFSTAGGDVQSNIARWAGQVRDAAGQPSKADVATRTVAGMTVHSVELTGAFANMGETTPHANWMLRGSVVETPGGLLFIKMTGPAEQMAATGAVFTGMVDGVKK